MCQIWMALSDHFLLDQAQRLCGEFVGAGEYLCTAGCLMYGILGWVVDVKLSKA